MAQDHSEREALCAPHRVIYVNAGGSQPTFRRDRTSRTLVVLAVLGLAMCAALVMLGSNEDAVMAAGKDHGVVLSTAREQSLSAAKADLDALSDDVDDDDEDEDEDKDDDDTDADKKDDGKDDGKEETAAKSQVTPSLASGDAGQEEEGPPKDDADSEPDTADPDEGKDDGAPAAPAEKEKSADDLIAEEQAAEKVPPPPGCSSTAKDCLKTCLTQNAVEGDKVESLMGMSKDYAECFINECEVSTPESCLATYLFHTSGSDLAHVPPGQGAARGQEVHAHRHRVRQVLEESRGKTACWLCYARGACCPGLTARAMLSGPERRAHGDDGEVHSSGVWRREAADRRVLEHVCHRLRLSRARRLWMTTRIKAEEGG